MPASAVYSEFTGSHAVAIAGIPFSACKREVLHSTAGAILVLPVISTTDTVSPVEVRAVHMETGQRFNGVADAAKL